MGKRIKLRKGILSNITQTIENVSDIAEKAITDKDEYYKLQHGLQELRANLLLGGDKVSVTKITLCALVSLVVSVGTFVFLTNPENMILYKDYALSVTPLLGILIGVFGTGRTLKKSKWMNGNK